MDLLTDSGQLKVGSLLRIVMGSGWHQEGLHEDSVHYFVIVMFNDRYKVMYLQGNGHGDMRFLTSSSSFEYLTCNLLENHNNYYKEVRVIHDLKYHFESQGIHSLSTDVPL